MSDAMHLAASGSRSLARDFAAGLATLPRAVSIIRTNRPLIALTAVGAVLAAGSILFFVGFYWLLMAPGASRGTATTVAGLLCLSGGLATMPIWGPVTFAIEVRARDLTRAALAGAAAPGAGPAWWRAQTLAGLVAAGRRLLLLFVAGLLSWPLIFLSARLLGADSIRMGGALQGLVATGLASADAYRKNPTRRDVAAGPIRLGDAVRRIPRFAGFWAGMMLLWSLRVLWVLVPTLGPVAGTLWQWQPVSSRATRGAYAGE